MDLIEALKIDDCFVRARAVEALGKIDDPRAIEPLREVLDDDALTVRNAASDALEKLGAN